MSPLQKIYENSIAWAERIKQHKSNFFSDLSKQKSAEYLWIGCSDSRVVTEQLGGLQLSELFVHRNIANVVIPTDLNCLSVIQFAVEALKVKHIIVCGGVKVSMQSVEHGLIDNWLFHIKSVHQKHEEELLSITDETERDVYKPNLNILKNDLREGN